MLTTPETYGGHSPLQSPLPWHFAFSSTLKAIYLIRFLLFSGGVAIAFAIGQRIAFGNERALTGLAIGLLLGLVLFRGQLRSLRWPTLTLSQEAIYLAQGKRVLRLPWTNVRKVAATADSATLELWASAVDPDGSSLDQVVLEARKLGTTADVLATSLQSNMESVELRARLPTDARVTTLLKLA